MAALASTRRALRAPCLRGAAAGRPCGAWRPSGPLLAWRQREPGACAALATLAAAPAAAPPAGGDRPRSWAGAALLCAAGAGAALGVGRRAEGGGGPARCEAAGGGELRFVTYNVLAPPLAEQKGHFSQCEPGALVRSDRLERVLRKLEPHIAAGSVIGLQEVSLEWAGKLYAAFSKRNYTFVYCSYGQEFNGYMGVGLAWPNELYETVDVELCRLSDTVPREIWAQKIDARPADGMNRFGFLTEKGLREILGCQLPAAAWASREPPKGEDWAVARSRRNELAVAKLRPRGGGSPFCVACYHMPCLFGPPEKVRTRNIHALLMLGKVHEFAAGDACVFLGDFNWNPRDSSYMLLESGGDVAAVAAQSDTFRQEVLGLEPAAQLASRSAPGGLRSAYKAFHGSEPRFTNYARNRDNPPFCETLDYIVFSAGRFRVLACPELPRDPPQGIRSFPSLAEPSDHVLMAATLRPEGGAP